MYLPLQLTKAMVRARTNIAKVADNRISTFSSDEREAKQPLLDS